MSKESVRNPAIEGSLVGGDKYPLKLQKFGDALRKFGPRSGSSQIWSILGQPDPDFENQIYGSGSEKIDQIRNTAFWNIRPKGTKIIVTFLGKLCEIGLYRNYFVSQVKKYLFR